MPPRSVEKTDAAHQQIHVFLQGVAAEPHRATRAPQGPGEGPLLWGRFLAIGGVDQGVSHVVLAGGQLHLGAGAPGEKMGWSSGLKGLEVDHPQVQIGGHPLGDPYGAGHPHGQQQLGGARQGAGVEEQAPLSVRGALP